MINRSLLNGWSEDAVKPPCGPPCLFYAGFGYSRSGRFSWNPERRRPRRSAWNNCAGRVRLFVKKPNIVGLRCKRIKAAFDPSGASTMAACKIVREMLLALKLNKEVRLTKKEENIMGKAYLLSGAAASPPWLFQKCCQNNDILRRSVSPAGQKKNAMRLKKKL